MTPPLPSPLGVNIFRFAQIWALFTPEQRKRLLTARKEIKIKRNDIVYRQGDTPQYLYFVKHGIVQVERGDRPDRSHTLRFIAKGEIFGYRAALARQKYLSTAIAFEACTIFCIPFQLIFQLLQEVPSLTLMLVEDLAIELGRSDCRIVGLTQKHLRGRVADTLLFLVENFGIRRSDNTLQIKLTRQKFANLANMTTANAIRTLTALANEGVIELDGREIRILNIEAIHEISDKG